MDNKKNIQAIEEPGAESIESAVEKPKKRKTKKKTEVVEQAPVEAAVKEEPVEPVSEAQDSVPDEKPVEKAAAKSDSSAKKKKAAKSSAETQEKQESEAAPAPAPAPKKRKRRVKEEIDTAARDTRAQLKAAVQSMKILRGQVEILEIPEKLRDPDRDILVVTYYDGFKIIIPACHMGLTIPSDVTMLEKAKYYKRYISAMMAAEFDYVVVAVDNAEKLAVGNRQIAMGIQRKRNYVTKYKNTGKSFMEFARDNAIPVPAKVMAVSGTVVRLDVGGCEAIVRAKDAAWRYTSNLSELFHPGQEIKVIVKAISHTDSGWRIEVSIREATPNRLIENAKKFKTNSVCVGTVSGATENGYFIAIGDTETGIDAFCGLVHGEVPQIGDKVSCTITKIDTDKGYALAKINRILQRASRNHY